MAEIPPLKYGDVFRKTGWPPNSKNLIGGSEILRNDLEALRADTMRQIAGLQVQLDWVEDAIAKLDQ